MGINVRAKVRQATRRKYTAEEKIRIILGGLRGEIAILKLCRREGVAPTMYYRWSRSFLDAGKNGVTRGTLSRRRAINHQPQGPDGGKHFQ
jgi:transposase-like protein